MTTQIILDIVGFIIGGGAGAGVMQLCTMRANKKKAEAEALKEQELAEREKINNRQDAFETMYQELSKCMSDYAAISEEYRNYREKARKYEESVQQQIQDKCLELAAMKTKIMYLKGIRCYNMQCQYRVSQNPEKEIINTDGKVDNK